LTFVSTISSIAQSLHRIRAQPTHVMFAGYLHLQERAAQLGRLDNLHPKFRDFFDRFFHVEGHPIGAPYIKPFNPRPTDKNLWLNPNVAGTYAATSIRPGQAFSQVVEVKSRRYTLPPDHARLALEHLLFGQRMSAGDLAIFLYREYGFLTASPNVEEVIDIFAYEFGYAEGPGAPRSRDFETLFETHENSDVRFEEFRAHTETEDIASRAGRISPYRTPHKVQTVTADQLLLKSAARKLGEPPLQELRIKGLLSFGEETTFRFGKLNVLVGPNGSGKSNLIDCLRVFREAPRDIQQVFARGGLENWLFKGLDKLSGSGTLDLIVWPEELPKPVRHQLRLGPPLNARAQLEELIDIATEDIGGADHAPYFIGSYRSQAMLSIAGGKRRRERNLDPTEYNPFQSILGQIRDTSQFPEITRIAQLYSGCRIYSEWTFGRTSKLRDAATADRSDTQLSEDMHDLPVALNALANTKAHESILQFLREVKETYRDYTTKLMFGRIGLELSEVPFKSPVPQDRLSDGTLRFLALAAILLQEDLPPLICIEEPELGMHPDMIRMVARMIVTAADRSQLIISTHSEHLLTSLQDDFDALFAFNSAATGSFVRCFTQREYVEWRENHSLGELWSSGELGGNRW